MKSCRKILKQLLLVSLLFMPAAGWAYSETDLMALSLEELTSLEVTSVSRKAQKVSEAAAAVFVITQDDIRRSGATSIPDALRLAPGLSVARIDGSKWAVSSRGFNGRFANKLLVLIDGRSVYSPLFSGVYWDVQDTLLEDVERIEVIRGPGATLWGANAVNGVINVITKKARDTQGALIKAGYGTEEEGFAALRYGGKAGDRAYYRAFVKYFNRDRLDRVDTGTASDDWDSFRGGFRLDATPSRRDEFTLQGEAYSGTAGQQDLTYVWTPPSYQATPISDTEFAGGHLLARWQRQLNDNNDFVLQAYYDRSYRDENALLKETRTLFDIDFQHRFLLEKRHELLWGLCYRLTSDDLESTEMIVVDDEARSDQLFSFFVQDEITLMPERLRLLLGSKFEHNDYTGFEYQPNARIIWTPSTHHSLWAAVSRAVRTPSRLEDNGDIFYKLLPPNFYPDNPLPTKLVINGSEDYEAEKSLSCELGYRYLPGGGFSIDTALFYTDYWDHRSGESLVPVQVGTPVPSYMLAGYEEDNKLQAETWGLEVSVDWRLRDWWRLQGNYTLLKVNLSPESDSSDNFSDLVYEDSSPQQQWSLRSSFDLGRNWELDLWLRYVDRITVTYTSIDDYYGLDMRLAWQPVEGLELALTGQNLLETSHQEFQTEMGTIPTAVPRGFYGQVKWQF